jgi:hypothetical protein
MHPLCSLVLNPPTKPSNLALLPKCGLSPSSAPTKLLAAVSFNPSNHFFPGFLGELEDT